MDRAEGTLEGIRPIRQADRVMRGSKGVLVDPVLHPHQHGAI